MHSKTLSIKVSLIFENNENILKFLETQFQNVPTVKVQIQKLMDGISFLSGLSILQVEALYNQSKSME